jgi:hypothetical protein
VNLSEKRAPTGPGTESECSTPKLQIGDNSSANAQLRYSIHDHRGANHRWTFAISRLEAVGAQIAATNPENSQDMRIEVNNKICNMIINYSTIIAANEKYKMSQSFEKNLK